MRVVSLLPSATDIVVALGAEEDLVGVSHSCGARWAHLPRLTSTRIDVNASSAAIDAEVKGSSEPLYDLDIETLERLAPDVVISQSLCDVCAVPSGDVEKAVRHVSSRPALVNLSPFRLADIPEGVEEVGAAIGRTREAAAFFSEWEEAFAELEERERKGLSVAFLDWLDPPFAAGHWIPDIIEALGCVSVLARPGEPSREITWDDVRSSRADLVVAACCGLTEPRAGRDVVPEDIDIRILDGYEDFSRPSPRLIESARVLARVIDSV